MIAPRISITPTDNGVRVIVGEKVYELNYTPHQQFVMGQRFQEMAWDRASALPNKNTPQLSADPQHPTIL